MKRGAIIVLTALLFSSVVFAQQTNQEKVICELSSGNCLKEADLLQKRIKKLNQKIKKGNKYSPEELKKLEQKLKEAQDILDKLESGK